MNIGRKLLPIVYPPINAFPHHGALFSMLFAQEDCLPYVYNNFIQIYSLKNLHENTARSGTVDFFYNPYGDWRYFHLKANPWIRPSLIPYHYLTLFSINVVEFVKHAIDSNMYVFIDIDEYDIAAYYESFRKFHFPHEMFIYGYDDDSRIFFFGDIVAGRYVHAEASYEEVEHSVRRLLGIYIRYDETYMWHDYREKSIYLLRGEKKHGT